MTGVQTCALPILELVAKENNRSVYKDFAHAPSKVKATLQAVREQFPSRKVTACLELHTYSSLNREFLSQYRGALDAADSALVYFNPHALQLKRLPEITTGEVMEGFGKPGMEVYTDSTLLVERLFREKESDAVLLMMSSGNYDGVDLKGFASQWVSL